METLHFPSFPKSSSRAHLALFTSLSSSALSTLRQRIIDASLLPLPGSPESNPISDDQREAVNFAFINPSLVTSKLHLQTAIYQAILSESQSALRTKTVHSEILWVLNPTNNISEAIRRYGVPSNSNSSNSAALLVVRIIEGTLVSLDILENLTDWTTVKKYYKLSNESWMKGVNEVEERQNVDNIVTSTVAMKSVAT